jgi:hypothetical protein
MNRNFKTLPPALARRVKAKNAKARRQPMSSGSAQLEERIVAILHSAGEEALSLRQIEERLAEQGYQATDAFAVRDAVWGLITKRQADFTPRRYVKAVGV